jgi:threonine synthase
LSGGNYAEIKDWMTKVDSTSKNDVTLDWLTKLQQEFRSERITDDEMCATIRELRDEFHYMIDPHTAVAFAAASKLGYYNNTNGNAQPVILLSTASPCKFQESVTVAIGEAGWQEYFNSELFPPRARAVLEREELEPCLCKAQESVSLEENQQRWERQALSIICDLGSAVQ